MLRVGGHLSLGLEPRRTVEAAAAAGYSCMQIFVSSPGAWKPPAWAHARAEDFLAARRAWGIEPLFIHAVYLINLASEDARILRRSVQSLVETMHVADRLQAAGVVTHIGSHRGRGFPAVSEQVAQAVRLILDRSPETVALVLENSAGSGGLIGADFSDLGGLISAAGGDARLKFALDTAHACAAGWDFTRPETPARLVETLDRDVGLDRLLLLHANDSKAPCGSRRDRHANIGQGFIGIDGFRHLVAAPALTGVPWVLETPIVDEQRPDRDPRVDDMSALQSLATASPSAFDRASREVFA